MSIITIVVNIKGKVASKSVEALIDTGAEGNYINKRVYKDFIKLGVSNFFEEYVAIPNSKKKVLCPAFTFREMRFSGKVFRLPEFIVVKDIDYEVVIGVEVLQSWKVKIDMALDRVS